VREALAAELEARMGSGAGR